MLDSLEDIDPRRYYTPAVLERPSGIPRRTIRLAPDLPRLRVDGWNRINGGDFLAWLESRKVGPDTPPREAAILARVAAAVRREQAPESP